MRSCAKDEEIVTKNVFICCATLANNKYNLQIKTKIAKWPQSPIKKNAFKVKKEYYRWPLTAKILLTCLPSVSFTEWYFFYLTCVMMMLNHCCWRVAWSSATERQGCVDWSVESEAWFLSPRSVSLSHTHTQLVDTEVRYPSSTLDSQLRLVTWVETIIFWLWYISINIISINTSSLSRKYLSENFV